MYVPDHKLDPPIPENRPEVHCYECCCTVDDDDPVFLYEDEYLCYDCFLKKVFDEKVWDYVAYDPMLARNVADLIGVEYWRVSELVTA